MSRNIDEKAAVTISEEEYAARSTDGGKLIFTRYREKSCALLLQRDRLAVAAFPGDSRVGAIYLARVKDIVPNISACFVEIQPGEICFLPLKEARFPFLLNRAFDGRIKEGDELPVQIVRDAQKTKQPSVTAHISLSNDYFALVFGPPGVSFSAKLGAEQKKTLEAVLTQAGIVKDGKLRLSGDGFPYRGTAQMPSAGLIVRTRAAGFTEGSAEQLAGHFKSLWDEYMGFFQNTLHRTCFSCLRKTDAIDDIMARILSQLVAPDEFSELLTDDKQVYAQLEGYRAEHMPEKSLRLYEDSLLPLSKLYGLESKMEEALGERVWLKSGGYLMIQPTEALTVIDVNSGKYEGRGEAAFRVNLEAAEEIARQIRLRNLSGIIVVDFINMEEEESRAEVMRRLEKYVRRDRVKTVVVDMTPLGLVEITRKKITRPLREALKRLSDS